MANKHRNYGGLFENCPDYTHFPSFSVWEMNVTQHLKHVACGGEKRMALGNRRLVSLSPLPMYQRVTGVYLRPFPLCYCNKTEIKKKTGSTCFFFISAVTSSPEILGYQNERVSHSLPLWVIFRYEGVFKILNVYLLSLYLGKGIF